MHGGTDVVAEAGQSHPGRARAPADRGGGFEHPHRAARARERDGRSQSVRPCANDDGVVNDAVVTDGAEGG